ncbi:MAG: hypothetical protein HOP19_07080 [Acidobacteria bacterium]|nr:hypothetical protein [Acidobacteriota bacterium]
MSVTKDITILALTKMHGGVCTAGIDADGQWVRPVRTAQQVEHGITDHCLLPLDFFHGGQSHLVNLGVTRFTLDAPAPQPPHSEDWTLNLKQKPSFIRKLSTSEQTDFLAAHAESTLTLADPGRSLTLIKPDDYRFTFSRNQTGDDVTVRASFSIGATTINDIGCTDLRLRVLGRKLCPQADAAPYTLNQTGFARHGKEAMYLAVGLSRLHQGKHWLIVVGVHTLPELALEIDYAKL